MVGPRVVWFAGVCGVWLGGVGVGVVGEVAGGLEFDDDAVGGR
jgi:hypothetical protein